MLHENDATKHYAKAKPVQLCLHIKGQEPAKCVPKLVFAMATDHSVMTALSMHLKIFRVIASKYTTTLSRLRAI